MTREEAIRCLDVYSSTNGSGLCTDKQHYEAKQKAIKALEQEPLTDKEQRIFLAAMGREEKICREVCADGDGIDLVMVCCEIKRKVKKALWK